MVRALIFSSDFSSCKNDFRIAYIAQMEHTITEPNH
ncbi:hypothetical protein NC652_011348 [Populus alba x Populus x berolinensis]|nr:hypothetical protein NC651_011116 [Populus alba x Populus x berolinensis]KAJ6936604.1 hypothetical protein NC652_011348 [Populus alba x Populus x berolinensis]